MRVAKSSRRRMWSCGGVSQLSLEWKLPLWVTLTTVYMVYSTSTTGHLFGRLPLTIEAREGVASFLANDSQNAFTIHSLISHFTLHCSLGIWLATSTCNLQLWLWLWRV